METWYSVVLIVATINLDFIQANSKCNNGTCLQYFSTEMSWLNASLHCQQFPNGSLANDADIDMKFDYTGDIWLASFPHGDHWQWVDDRNSSDLPSTDAKVECAYIIRGDDGYDLEVSDCTERRPFFCEGDSKTRNVSRNWWQARAICLQEQHDLISRTNLTYLEVSGESVEVTLTHFRSGFIQHMGNGEQEYWIRLYKPYHNEPNEFCSYLTKSQKFHEIPVSNCIEQKGFVCRYDEAPSTTPTMTTNSPTSSSGMNPQVMDSDSNGIGLSTEDDIPNGISAGAVAAIIIVVLLILITVIVIVAVCLYRRHLAQMPEKKLAIVDMETYHRNGIVREFDCPRAKVDMNYKPSFDNPTYNCKDEVIESKPQGHTYDTLDDQQGAPQYAKIQGPLYEEVSERPTSYDERRGADNPAFVSDAPGTRGSDYVAVTENIVYEKTEEKPNGDYTVVRENSAYESSTDVERDNPAGNDNDYTFVRENSAYERPADGEENTTANQNETDYTLVRENSAYERPAEEAGFTTNQNGDDYTIVSENSAYEKH